MGCVISNDIGVILDVFACGLDHNYNALSYDIVLI